MPDSMPTITLYKRQRQIVEYVSQFIQRNGFSPTLREIADAMGLSSIATVHEHVQKLVKKGVFKKEPMSNRGIELVDKRLGKMNKGIDLPILGWIAAGSPIEPYEEADATLQVSPTMLKGKARAFVLQVRGESMVDEGILDGDYVVVEEQTEVHDGDIVVAILENGLATLKKFFKEATRIRLEPANSQMAPIFATRVQIQGKVTGIIRKFNNN